MYIMFSGAIIIVVSILMMGGAAASLFVQTLSRGVWDSGPHQTKAY